MKLFKYLIIVTVFTFFAILAAHGQIKEKSGENSSSTPITSIKSSAAYAEVLLRKTEIQADLEAFSAAYTPENPKILDLRAEAASLDKDLERMFAVKPSETSKLTVALGKLIVRKAALEADLAHLMRSYNKDYPEAKRAQKRVDYFDSAIKELLR